MVVFACYTQAQSNHKTIIINNDTTQIDSVSISPVGFVLEGIDSTEYTINFATSELYIFDKKHIGKHIKVEYTRFIVDFTEEYYHKDQNKYVLNIYDNANPFIYRPKNEQFSLIDNNELQKMGSISRGVSFGNNQDLSVNSNLNLQLSGKVANNVSILAAITDDNIPIQPDGSTNQLQDFDKVFIQLYNEQNKLIVGDFQTKYNNGSYLRYFKKAQGGLFETKTNFSTQNNDSLGLLTSTVGASLSRGKYARNVFNGVEGNQGPYRLTGANNERFIIVLSGTELVFIDGKQLKRGQEFDYIIDYNTAEITFTANQLITKDKRIVVEFQYSDRNYARTMLQLNESFENEKLSLNFNVFSEQDAKNQPLLQELSNQQKALLTASGDSIENAYASSAILTPYNENEVLYKMIDTLSYDSVFVFSINAEDSLYRVSFSYVGEGVGHYIQSNSIANGKVYEWVEFGGNFEPIILLAAPEKRQMINVQSIYKLKENTAIKIEGALSNRDINTFSSINNEDDIGGALNIALDNKIKVKKKSTIETSIYYETIGARFNYIERFREVEFDRDWNLRNIQISSLQNRGGIILGYKKKGLGEITYGAGLYSVQNNFIGLKNDVNIISNNKHLLADIKSSYLISEGFGEKTEFFRIKSLVVKPLSVINLGFTNDFENNKRKTIINNRLSPLSYGFNEWETFVQTSDTMSNYAKLSYGQRHDFSTKNDAFRDSTIAKNLALEFQLLNNKFQTLKTKTTYRVLTIADTSIKNVKADSTILNRVEYGLRLLNGAVVSNTYYEIGSGLEIKKEYTFIKVPVGQGIYIHNDNNDNGLKELDEFEMAPQELLYSADYIKVYVPTSEYVKIYKNQFNQTIILRPKAVWRTNKGIKGFIGRFTNQLALKMDRKTNQKQALETYNPLIFNVADSLLVAQNSSFRNIFSFNRASTKFGVDFVYQTNNNKTLLTNGFEQRSKTEIELKPRWNITPKTMIKTDLKQGKKGLKSDFFTTRNYDITYYNIEPSFVLQPNTSYRVALNYKYALKENQSTLLEKATIHKIGIETRINVVEKGAVNTEINYINIKYPYASNSALGFEMLDGLSAGNNATWLISYQRTLANNLQINLTYNGRWSETSKVVHVGGIQARAFF